MAPKAIHKTRQIDARTKAKNGSGATVDDLSYETELSPAQLNRLHERSFVRVVSIHETTDSKDESTCLANILADSNARIDLHAVRGETRALLHTCINRLPTVAEQFVIKAYFGWFTDPLSLKQIGNVLLVTSERVRQIKAAALYRLRKQLKLHYRVKTVWDVCEAC